MNKVFLFLLFSFLTITSMAQEKSNRQPGAINLVILPLNLRNSTTMSFSAKSGAALTNSVCVTVVWLRSLHSLAKV